jgi:MFS family permease
MNVLRYRNYLLLVLLVILAFNYVDRLALGLALQDIKRDLSLSDTQLGLLTGIAFALFYSVMGIPIARWADRGNRTLIIAITTALWSVGVALCGAATSFLYLMLVRIGVAVGEAGCIPPAHSLIADHFDRSERPRAVARYMLGGSLSVVFGYFAAGWINEYFGWRVMFLVIGAPGVVLALLAWFTIREPRQLRATMPTAERRSEAEPALTEVLTRLWTIRTFRHLLFGFSVIYFFAYGINQWQPAFFMRSFGFGTGELGTWFSVIYGASGLLGTYLGGEWAARRARSNERLQLIGTGIAYCAAGLASVAIYFASSRYTALAALGVATAGLSMANGPLFATIQTLVPERMRAMSIAIIYLFANLIGMGLGPLAAGALSDLFRPVHGEESLRYALLTLCPGYLWAAWHLWRASRTVSQDLTP